MRLILNGKINSLYVQSLCMMFFRGEKFPKDEKEPRGEAIVTVKEQDNGVLCKAEVSYDGKAARAEHFEEFTSHETRDRTNKMSVGHAVFNACCDIAGYRPIWGLLTGIRPSAVASELVSKLGEEALDVLQKKYLLSYDRAKLAIETAKNENIILSNYNEKSCSVYISIPFCPTRCSYCSFISYATNKLFKLIPDYLARIVEDIKNTFSTIKKAGLKVVSVYVGGGTPTTLSVDQLKLVLSTIQSCLSDELKEFTVEGGRPDTITKDKIEVLKEFGVNRISVNPQTLNDSVLEKIGRRHTVDDFFNAFKIVSNIGFDCVNTDLIAGLDGDDFDSFRSTVDKIIELGPENITVHSFSVKKSASIVTNDADIYNKDSGLAVDCVNYARNTLLAKGYVPYYMYRQKNTIGDLENVGYAKGDTFGIYNVLMMADGHTVFGIGAGATTKLVRNINGKKEILRIFCPKYPYEYLQDNNYSCDKILNFLSGGELYEDD